MVPANFPSPSILKVPLFVDFSTVTPVLYFQDVFLSAVTSQTTHLVHA